MYKIKIITNEKDLKAKIFIDDKEIKNVRSYELKHSVDEVPTLKLELIALGAEVEEIVEVEISNSEFKTSLSDSFSKDN